MSTGWIETMAEEISDSLDRTTGIIYENLGYQVAKKFIKPEVLKAIVNTRTNAYTPIKEFVIEV